MTDVDALVDRVKVLSSADKLALAAGLARTGCLEIAEHVARLAIEELAVQRLRAEQASR